MSLADVGIEVERCFESSRLGEEVLVMAYEIVAPISVAASAGKSRFARSRIWFPREGNRAFLTMQGARL